MTAHKQGTLQPPVSDADHSAGRSDAPVTLVEYGDFECPYCFRAHPMVVMLQERLGDKLRFVFRNFPLTEMHPHALKAAEAAESVAANAGPDAFWRMHHAIYEHQQDSDDALDVKHLVRYAATAGADPVQVKLDLDEDTFGERVQEDFLSGVRSGVNGTPTFFINGRRFEGDWTNMRVLREALEEAASTPAEH
jgi:protein-disulfide isomerase